MLSLYCSIANPGVFARRTHGNGYNPAVQENTMRNQLGHKILPGLVITCALLLIIGAAWAKSNKAPSKTVTLQNGQGKKVGTAVLQQSAAGVSIQLNVHDLTPGDHGIHIHQVAKCEGPDFKSAGPHFNPDRKKHGLDNPDGPHAGDIPNFIVDANGKSKATVIAKGVTLGDGANSVFTNGGTALVIHAKADDGKTDPSGNSGDRIACGVITNVTVSMVIK
jgi:Cu-Zn family superoxide dismutase